MQSLVKGTRSLHHHAGFTRARPQCDTVPDEESPAVRAMSGVEMYKHGLVVRKDDREVCDEGERPMVPKGLSPALRPSVIPPETVIIHVYDISKYRQLNDVLTGFGRLPIAGLFHVGVEVFGKEWSYVYGRGIVCESPFTPKKAMYSFRESILLSRTELGESEVTTIIHDATPAWRGEWYHWLHKNCLVFANDFCRLLGVGRMPDWIDRLATQASAVDKGLQGISDILNTDMLNTEQCRQDCRARVLGEEEGPESVDIIMSDELGFSKRLASARGSGAATPACNLPTSARAPRGRRLKDTVPEDTRVPSEFPGPGEYEQGYTV